MMARPKGIPPKLPTQAKAFGVRGTKPPAKPAIVPAPPPLSTLRSAPLSRPKRVK